MAIYSLTTGECLCQKQLFGRIEVVKAKDDILATAHFGKDYDMGCITVRKIVSPSELPVIFSIYQDLYPVFNMDFTDEFLAALEWNATYNNVHAGNILVFPMLQSRLLDNLSEELTSFTSCRFLQETSLGTAEAKLLTGGHDKFVSFVKGFQKRGCHSSSSPNCFLGAHCDRARFLVQKFNTFFICYCASRIDFFEMTFF